LEECNRIGVCCDFWVSVLEGLGLGKGYKLSIWKRNGVGWFMGLFKRLKTPKATISITLEKGEFSLREPLTGTINVSSSEDFDVDEIRIEFEATEWTCATQSIDIEGNQRTVTARQTNRIHEGKTAIAGMMHVTDGFKKDFPFSINLPQGVPPSYRGKNATNTWKMKGVLAVKGRPDVTSHQMEVQINS